MKHRLSASLNALVRKARYRDEHTLDKLVSISFDRPAFQGNQLHPDTRGKFVRIFSIPLPAGDFGPFYRYVPKSSKLSANNTDGGYFTDARITCIRCAKLRLWLFDKERNYYYEGCHKLFRQKCFFRIVDGRTTTMFVGEVAHGDAMQVRPNNSVFSEPNRIVYKQDGELMVRKCARCDKFISQLAR